MDVGVDVCGLWALGRFVTRHRSSLGVARVDVARRLRARIACDARRRTPRAVSRPRARAKSRETAIIASTSKPTPNLFSRARSPPRPRSRVATTPIGGARAIHPNAPRYSRRARSRARWIGGSMPFSRIRRRGRDSSARGVDVGFSRAVRDRTRVRWWFYCRNRSNRAIDVDGGGYERWRDW